MTIRPTVNITPEAQLIKSFVVIDPFSLSAEESEHFNEDFYQLHISIFEGNNKTRAEFLSEVIQSEANWTRICIYKNSQNEWIGYCAVRRFNINVFGRPVVIFRAAAGLLRAYRGRSQTLWFGFRETLKYRLKHPFCEMYYLGVLLHPSVLYMFSRYFRQCYPNPKTPVTSQFNELMLELANRFDLELVPGQNVPVIKIGWATIESDEDRQYWQDSTEPAVNYYIKNNPDYIIGHGLLNLIPLNVYNTLFALGKFIKRKLTKRIAGR